MALTRKWLSTLGIETEKIDEIVAANSESVEGIKTDLEKSEAEVKRLKGDVEKYKAEAEKAQKDLGELQKQVEADTKEREGKDYDKLKEEFDNYKAEQEAKAVRSAKETALKELLSDMKMSDRGEKQVLKWMGVDGFELDDAGKIKDASALRKSIKEDWGDYIQTEGAKGAETSNPPGGGSGGTGKTKKEIMQIKNTKERQQAIADNPELFGLPASE